MKVVGEFNNVSEKLKEELIKPLKKDTPAVFQLLGGQYDVTTKRTVFGASKSFALSDRIYDPYHKQDKDGNYIGAYVDIGVPDVIKENRVERCQQFTVKAASVGVPGNGKFSLRANSVTDMEVYEFLCLSNGNENNPHRDKSKQGRWICIDEEAARRELEEKEAKELEARFKSFARRNPEKAAEMAAPYQPKKPEAKKESKPEVITP